MPILKSVVYSQLLSICVLRESTTGTNAADTSKYIFNFNQLSRCYGPLPMRRRAEAAGFPGADCCSALAFLAKLIPSLVIETPCCMPQTATHESLSTCGTTGFACPILLFPRQPKLHCHLLECHHLRVLIITRERFHRIAVVALLLQLEIGEERHASK
jgi:hypothetical protein